MKTAELEVTLLGHTQLSAKFRKKIAAAQEKYGFTDGQAITLTAIRNCYSALKPTEIINAEAGRYFGQKATDGATGSEADRLFRTIQSSGHTSTCEHIDFTFAIEGVSRALMAQLTRHRVGYSFSIESQRYVRFGSEDKSGGASFVIPETVHIKGDKALEVFAEAIDAAQEYYDKLRAAGVTAEDARSVLPNAAATNVVMTCNLTSLLTFYKKRRKGRGAQAEIAELAEALRIEVEEVEAWTAPYFESV